MPRHVCRFPTAIFWSAAANLRITTIDARDVTAAAHLHLLVQLVLQAAFKKTEGRRLTAAKKTISMIGKASPAD
jgi:hypothetical protein